MIDPVESLAFSLQANPRVYALLLGSGVSRAARIPTGWEIVNHLLARLAASTSATPDTDLEQWYIQTHGSPPDYSRLLNDLAKTPAERQGLLRPYFEPSAQERTEGLKLPTDAHKAIARLVGNGFIKVIVSTNFDRLMESALEDQSIIPTVMSTPDQVEGSPALDHLDCCLFKVHGDYIDTRIRNTPSELDDYPEPLKQLLHRIFDDYGLIVCGWSAAWDTALRDALCRVQSRRYTTYWATHGSPSEEATQLIRHRGAQVISIDAADTFFCSLEQKVDSIQALSTRHPLSTAAAVETLKRYLPREEHAIQLYDHIDSTVAELVRATSGTGFEIDAPQPKTPTITDRLHRYESASETLLSMAAVGGLWATAANCIGWERAAERLATMPRQLGQASLVWSHLRAYPGVMFLYALGLGAIEADNLSILTRIFRKPVTDLSRGEPESSSVLRVLIKHRDEADDLVKNQIEGLENNRAPMSSRLQYALREPLNPTMSDETKYVMTFDTFEIMAALAFAQISRADPYYGGWFPLGLYLWRSDNRRRIISRIEESINVNLDASPFVTSGLFGDTAKECLQMISDFGEYVGRVAPSMGVFR